MKRIRRWLPSPAMTIAMVALFVALSGTAVATTSALITGKQIKNSSITGADVKNKSLTPRDFRGSVRGPRGLQGPAGPQGPAGAQGSQGPQGPQGPGARWAVVNPDGTIARQSGGIAAAKPQAGGYIVNFGEDVSKRLFVGTPSLVNDGSARGTIVVGSCVDYAGYCGAYIPAAQFPNQVAVFTLSTAGAQQDHGYYLAAVGPAAAGAAAASDASLSSASLGN